MPYKVEQSQRIFRLQRSLRAKQRALQQLEQERARLHLREFLLSATCEVLELFLQRRAVLAQAPTPCVPLSSRPSDDLQSLDLIQIQSSNLNIQRHFQASGVAQQPQRWVSGSSREDTVHSSASAPQAASNATCSCFSTFPNLLATTDDPLQFLRALVTASIDSHPGSEHHDSARPDWSLGGYFHPGSISVDELRSYYCQVKNQLAVHMSYMEQTASTSGDSSCATGVLTAEVQEQHQEAVQQIINRYLHLINDIMMYNNSHVLVEFYSTDVIEGNALDNETDVHERVLQQLQLTDQQTDNILTCYGFLSSLYGPVTNHRSQLLQQKHLLHHPSSVTHSSHQDNPPAVTALLGGTEADSSSPQQQQKLQSRHFRWQKSLQQQQQLHWKHQQQHQQYLNTLGINMGKEVTITHIAAFTLWGCLSWSQVAKLILGCYPVPANPLVLAAVIQQQQQ